MQNQRSTRRRKRFADNLYERPGRKKGEHRYEVGYADVDGAWRMKTLKARTRTEARAERDEFLASLRRGEIVVPSKITLGEVIEEYLAGQDALVVSGERAERTVERYRQHLEGHVTPKLGYVPVQKLTPERLARFFHDKRESGLAPWTLRGLLTPLRRTLALAVRRRYIAENPLDRLSPEELPRGRSKHAPRTLSRREIDALLEHAPDRYRVLIAAAVYTGMRIQELLAVQWKMVELDLGVVHVRGQLTRGSRTNPSRIERLKTRAGVRDIVLLPMLSDLLRKHRRDAFATGRAAPDNYVFETSEGTPLNYRNVATRGLDKAANAAGLNRPLVPKLTFHDLRHTYGSHLVRQGLDPVRAARQMGHARPSITLDIYPHEFEEARGRDDIAHRLNAAFGV
jgi:integrase